MSKVVIADTGPIIVFTRLDRLALLPKVFERVYVTDAVVDESSATDEMEKCMLTLSFIPYIN